MIYNSLITCAFRDKWNEICGGLADHKSHSANADHGTDSTFCNNMGCHAFVAHHEPATADDVLPQTGWIAGEEPRWIRTDRDERNESLADAFAFVGLMFEVFSLFVRNL